MVQNSTLQYSTIQYSTLQYSKSLFRATLYCTKVDYVPRADARAWCSPLATASVQGVTTQASNCTVQHWAVEYCTKLYSTRLFTWAYFCAVQTVQYKVKAVWQFACEKTSQGWPDVARVLYLFYCTVLQYFAWYCTVHCSNKCIMQYHTGSQNTRVVIMYNVEKRTLLTYVKKKWL